MGKGSAGRTVMHQRVQPGGVQPFEHHFALLAWLKRQQTETHVLRSTDSGVQIIVEALRRAGSRSAAVKQRHHLLQFLRTAGFIIRLVTGMAATEHAVHVGLNIPLVDAHRRRIPQQHQQPDSQRTRARQQIVNQLV